MPIIALLMLAREYKVYIEISVIGNDSRITVNVLICLRYPDGISGAYTYGRRINALDSYSFV